MFAKLLPGDNKEWKERALRAEEELRQCREELRLCQQQRECQTERDALRRWPCGLVSDILTGIRI